MRSLGLSLLLAVLTASSAVGGVTVVERSLDLQLPVGLAHAGDGSERLFIVEQPGCIRFYRAGDVFGARCGQPGARFLDITDRVQATFGEQGLLGLAFHPDYESNGWFFVFYTSLANPAPPARNDGDIVIARYSVRTDPDAADPASERILMVISGVGVMHNGGQLAFGPDGFLYASVGDRVDADSAQDLGRLSGKILRVDVDVTAAPFYAIPASNPFVSGGPGTCGAPFPGSPCDEIWAYGLRNPWRFSFDRATGDLFIADVGEMSWEELDVQPAGAPGGRNYGWPVLEGGRHGSAPVPAGNCYRDVPAGACASFLAGGSTLPVLEYDHLQGLSITGGFVYRGPATDADLAGSYVFADLEGTVFRARPALKGWRKRPLFTGLPYITSFGEDERGNLFFVRFVGTTSGLFELVVDSAQPDACEIAPPRDWSRDQ